MEKVTVTDVNSDGTWEAAAAMSPSFTIPRWYSSGVLLPNGHVLAFSGGDTDDIVGPGTARGIRTPELWDGTSWRPLAEGARDRVYHNSALLLPDGSVLIGGHSPISRMYGASDGTLDDTGLVNNNLRDPSFERFYPPYLFAGGGRPKIRLRETSFDHGDPVTLKRSGPAIKSVVLSRLPAVTHTTDADQRQVIVAHHTDEGRTTFQIPRKRAVVPPGFYYVFALSASGVPSVAEIIRIA